VQSNYYDELGVTSSASAEEINTAFRRLAKKYHPDLNGGREQEVKPLFLRAQTAYEVLSDPARRAKYDARFSSTDDWGKPHSAPVYEIQPIDEFQITRTSLETSIDLPPVRRPLDPETRKVIIFVAVCVALAVLIVCLL
jgi:curved DNA-binding protein CbpA